MQETFIVDIIIAGNIYCGYYLQAANEITSLKGMDQLENLTVLHLRENQIQTLDGFSENLKHLKYINLRYGTVLEPGLLVLGNIFSHHCV